MMSTPSHPFPKIFHMGKKLPILLEKFSNLFLRVKLYDNFFSKFLLYPLHFLSKCPYRSPNDVYYVLDKSKVCVLYRKIFINYSTSMRNFKPHGFQMDTVGLICNFFQQLEARTSETCWKSTRLFAIRFEKWPAMRKNGNITAMVSPWWSQEIRDRTIAYRFASFYQNWLVESYSMLIIEFFLIIYHIISLYGRIIVWMGRPYEDQHFGLYYHFLLRIFF